MNENADIIRLIVPLIQQMGAQEARYVWRFVQALSGKGKDRA